MDLATLPPVMQLHHRTRLEDYDSSVFVTKQARSPRSEDTLGLIPKGISCKIIEFQNSDTGT